MKIFRKSGVAVLALIVSATMLQAAIYVETWEDGTLAGWKIKSLDQVTYPAPYGSLANVSPLGSDTTRVLQITGGGATGVIREDLIYVDSGPLAGNKDWAMIDHPLLAFQFYAAAAPVRMSAYFQSTTTGNIWLNDFTAAASATGWNDYALDLNYYDGSGWYLNSGGETIGQFFTDLSDVDELGIYIQYAGTGGEVFGLDNFGLIPEPETWLMIAFAMLSIVITYRDKLNEQLTLVMARIKK